MLISLLATNQFIPHGHCYLWHSSLVWFHLLSDSFIALAYYSIPITLVYFVNKRADLPYPRIFLLFGAFIVSCGTTHVMGIWTLWHPNYWISGFVKAFTALISVYTAFEMIPLVPQALALPSPSTLEKINQDLQQEISDREEVEQTLKQEIRERQRVEQLLNVQSNAAFILAQSETVSEAISKLIQNICQNLNWDWGELWTVDGKKLDETEYLTEYNHPLRCIEFWHLPSLNLPEFETNTRQISFIPTIGLPGRVWASGESLWIEDVVKDDNFLRRSSAAKEGLHGAFGFPIRLGNHILGVFAFLSRKQRLIEPDLLALFNTLGSQIGQFIERQQAKLALTNSQLLLDGVLNSSLDGVMAFESIRNENHQMIDFRWLLANPSAVKLVRRTNLIGKQLLVELPGNQSQGLFDLYVSVVETGKPIEQEFYYALDGIESWFRIAAVKLGDGFTVTFRDITKNKQDEAALRESERRLSTLISNLPGYVYRIANNLNYSPEFISDGVFAITGYRPEEYLIEQTISRGQEIYPGDRDSIAEKVEQAIETQKPYECVYRIITKSGSEKWVWERGRGIYGEKNEFLYLEGFITDISDLEATKLALEEKETMLKEIHHRVKNNLQVISSLLNLQSRSINDPYLLDKFKESQNRVQSMSLIHEQLYQSDNLSRIQLAQYIPLLGNNLLRSYGMNGTKIKLKTEIEPIFSLNIDTAVPCALIVNEIISNAIKYAFINQENPEIMIQALPDTDRNLVLKIRDNGIGLPDDFNLEKIKTLGLKLVKNLTNQLRGKIEINNNEGTEFTITLTRVKMTIDR